MSVHARRITGHTHRRPDSVRTQFVQTFPSKVIDVRCDEGARQRGPARVIGQLYQPVVAMAVTAALVPACAEAGEQEVAARPPYVRIYSGVGVTRNSDLHIRQPALSTELTFENVSWEHRSLTTNWTRDSIPYMGMRAGFFLRSVPWLGLSFEAVHFKILAETQNPVRVTGMVGQVPIDVVAPMKQFVEVYRVTNGVNLFLVNLQAHHGLARSAGFPRGRVDLYGGAGGGVTMPYTSSVIAGESRSQNEWGRFATQLMGGIAWHLAPRWDISLEYRFTVTTVDGEVAHGDSESRLHTNHLVIGLGYHFGG